ncbi:MAG TPA: M23 family metallopeptidase [Prolixibacteraceae bacterium]|nr:M23 family metallopeptidase [Prolixibacteraceae bacterium]
MAEINKYRIQIPEKKVTFSNPSSATFAFDPANGQGLCYEYTKQYDPDPMGISNDNDGEKFSLCWKFIPPNNSDAVTATLPQGIDRTKLKFITSNLTEITFDAAASGNTVQLTLPGGDAGSQYSLHAVYQADDDRWKQVGRMDVISFPTNTLNVKIIPLGAPPADIDQAELAGSLNGIYNRYGINWTLTVDNEFNKSNELGGKATEIQEIIPNYQLTRGDAFFSEYSSQQNDLNALYKSYLTEKGSYNNETVYLFVLPNAPEGAELTTGDMPIGKQWGYLFGSAVDARTLAHELGHGKLELRHTFASEACGIQKQGQSNNLMDYPATGSSPLGGGREGASDSLVCQQWNYIHKPAIIGKVFQDDGAGAIYNRNMSEENVISMLERIRNGNLENERFINLTEWSVSEGLHVDLPLSESFTLSFIKLVTYIGNQVAANDPLNRNPLMIRADEIEVIDSETPLGEVGDFSMVFFQLYDLDGVGRYVRNETSKAIELVIRTEDVGKLKVYLLGLELPLKTNEFRGYSYGNWRPVSATYGCTRVNNKYDCNEDGIFGDRPHMGVDIIAPIGTKCYSLGDGIVHRVQEISGYGTCVAIKVGLKDLTTQAMEQFYVLYAHLSETNVVQGENVIIGDLIGKTGVSGATFLNNYPSEQHLHLEVIETWWPNGFDDRKNPESYIIINNAKQ